MWEAKVVLTKLTEDIPMFLLFYKISSSVTITWGRVDNCHSIYMNRLLEVDAEFSPNTTFAPILVLVLNPNACT
jgi:hypothetical protein